MTALALALALGACKGRSPNYVRKDLPVAGEPYGPGGIPDGGFAHAFSGTELVVVTADGRTIFAGVWREDGLDQGRHAIVEVSPGLWDVGDERIAGELGEGALDFAGHDAIAACLPDPKKRTETIVLDEHGIVRLPSGDGWALAFSAMLELQCQTPGKVVRHERQLDYILELDEDLAPTADPVLVRYGEPTTTVAMVVFGKAPALAWVTRAKAGFTSEDASFSLPTADGELEHPPMFVAAGDRLAVITRIAGSIHVRLVEDDPTDPAVDLSISPGLAPLAYAAAWTGDRLGVFVALDRTEGTGTILQHVLVEVFPDGEVSPAVKVYAQYSMAEDAHFTRSLTATYAKGAYALAWIADDGYSQDVHIQEVPVGGVVPEPDRMTWQMDLGDGYRAASGLALFATPPQYVLVILTKKTHLARLTALPL